MYTQYEPKQTKKTIQLRRRISVGKIWFSRSIMHGTYHTEQKAIIQNRFWLKVIEFGKIENCDYTMAINGESLHHQKQIDVIKRQKRIEANRSMHPESTKTECAAFGPRKRKEHMWGWTELSKREVPIYSDNEICSKQTGVIEKSRNKQSTLKWITLSRATTITSTETAIKYPL